jgi:hypothetical protein
MFIHGRKTNKREQSPLTENKQAQVNHGKANRQK